MDAIIPDADQALAGRLNDSELVQISIGPQATDLYLEFVASGEKITLELVGVRYLSVSREHSDKARYFIREVILSGIGIGESAIVSSSLTYSQAKYESGFSFRNPDHHLFHVNVEGEINIDALANRYRIKKS